MHEPPRPHHLATEHLDDGLVPEAHKWQDAEAARAVNCTSLLLQSPWNGTARHDFVLPNLAAVVEKILRLRASKPLMGAYGSRFDAKAEP